MIHSPAVQRLGLQTEARLPLGDKWIVRKELLDLNEGSQYPEEFSTCSMLGFPKHSLLPCVKAPFDT
jgi:hypothetical protein